MSKSWEAFKIDAMQGMGRRFLQAYLRYDGRN